MDEHVDSPTLKINKTFGGGPSVKDWVNSHLAYNGSFVGETKRDVFGIIMRYLADACQVAHDEERDSVYFSLLHDISNEQLWDAVRRVLVMQSFVGQIPPISDIRNAAFGYMDPLRKSAEKWLMIDAARFHLGEIGGGDGE